MKNNRHSTTLENNVDDSKVSTSLLNEIVVINNTDSVPHSKSQKLRSKLLTRVLLFKGYYFTLMSAFLHSVSKVLLKNAKLLVGSEHSVIRYVLQVLVLFIVIKHLKLDALGPKSSRKLLSLRGIIGSIGMVCIHFSITFIDPSDTVALTHSSIIITAILARIFLKEKLTLFHLISLVLTINGILFISQPSFLFNSSSTASTVQHIITINDSGSTLFYNLTFTNQHSDEIKFVGVLSSAKLLTIMGIFFGICGAFSSGTNHTLIKKLCNEKVHYSITTIYSAYFGLPLSFIISLILFSTGQSHQNQNLNAPKLLEQLMYSIGSGLLGLMAQICLNVAMMYEDATRVSILRTADLFFTFLLQYFMLSITKSYFDILGACSILLGSFLILLFKYLDKSVEKKSTSSISNANKNPNCFTRFMRNLFFFKF